MLIKRATYLKICLSSCHSVCPATSRSPTDVLPTVKKTYAKSLLMIFLSFLDTALLNLVVLLLATADERHRTQYYCASG